MENTVKCNKKIGDAYDEVYEQIDYYERVNKQVRIVYRRKSISIHT